MIAKTWLFALGRQPVTRTRSNVLPGFGITMGYTLLYLCLIVLIPLSTLFLSVITSSGEGWVLALSDPRSWPRIASRSERR